MYVSGLCECLPHDAELMYDSTPALSFWLTRKCEIASQFFRRYTKEQVIDGRNTLLRSSGPRLCSVVRLKADRERHQKIIRRLVLRSGAPFSLEDAPPATDPNPLTLGFSFNGL